VAVKTGIIGSTGYAGEFLIRILSRHPETEISCLCSKHGEGKEVSTILPGVSGMEDRIFDPEDIDLVIDRCEVVFTAKKSTESMEYAPILLKKGLKVIDIGGEFRLRSKDEYEKWYGNTHTCPELLSKAVYGMCELNRGKIKDASLVSNPGCYPTGVILAVYPFIKRMKDEIASIGIAASSGISGAGRTPTEKNLFVNCFNSHSAYGIGAHKHVPEIEQELGFKVTFVPQLASIDRGILSVICIHLREGCEPPSPPNDILIQHYEGEKFIRAFDAAEEVTAGNVRGTNFCDLHAVFIPRTGVICVVSAIDNLIKGASGQAIQNLNIMYGIDEDTGLFGEVF